MNIIDSLNDIGRKSLVASNQVKNFTSEEKNNLLIKIAEKINSDKELILNANQKDISISSGCAPIARTFFILCIFEASSLNIWGGTLYSLSKIFFFALNILLTFLENER